MLEDLILLRLLSVADPADGDTLSKIRNDLHPLVSVPKQEENLWRETFNAAVGRLTQADHLLTGGPGGARLRLTESGRARARSVFNVSSDKPHPFTDDHKTSREKSRSRKQPARGWAWWRDHYVLPKALATKHAITAAELRAALLCRLYLPELPAGAAPQTLAAAVDLLLAKRLAVSLVSLTAFRTAVVRVWAAGGGLPTENASAGKLETSPSASAYIRSEPQRTPASKAALPHDLHTFAERVRDTARRTETGRFGDNKVFISHVWRSLVDTGLAGPDEERVFKQLLTRANTAGTLRLSRADLASSQEAADVQASETRYLGESFHFIQFD